MKTCLGCGLPKHAGLCHTTTPKASKPRVDTPSLAAQDDEKQRLFNDLVTLRTARAKNAARQKAWRERNKQRKEVLESAR